MTSFKERGKKMSKCAYNFLLPLANTLQVLKTREPRAEHLWQYAPPRHLWDYWALISSVLSKGWSFSFLFPALPALSSGLSRNLREDILRKSPRPWKVTEGLKVNPLWTWSLMCLGNVCWQPRDPRGRTREGILPLCSAKVRSHLQSCIQLWHPQYESDIGLLEWV